ncbi:MAG: LysR family transcriptional regulator substrate-binding protein, partial [Thiothrix sp.]
GWEIVKRYVEQGLGVSIVTEVCLTGKENICAIPMHDYFPSRGYGLIVRRGKFFTPQAKRFIEMFDEDFFAEIS